MAKKTSKRTTAPQRSSSTSKLVARTESLPRRRRVVQQHAAREGFDELPDRFRVRATRLGIHDHKRRRVGNVFIVEQANYNPSWMERVAANTPLRQTSGAQELKQQMREIAIHKRAEQTGEKISDGLLAGRDDVDQGMDDTGDNPLNDL